MEKKLTLVVINELPYLLSDDYFREGYCYNGSELIYYNGDYGDQRPSGLRKVEIMPQDLKNCYLSAVEPEVGLRSVGIHSLEDWISIIKSNNDICYLRMEEICKPGCLNLVLNGTKSMCCGDKVMGEPALQDGKKVIVI